MCITQLHIVIIIKHHTIQHNVIRLKRSRRFFERLSQVMHNMSQSEIHKPDTISIVITLTLNEIQEIDDMHEIHSKCNRIDISLF